MPCFFLLLLNCLIFTSGSGFMFKCKVYSVLCVVFYLNENVVVISKPWNLSSKVSFKIDDSIRARYYQHKNHNYSIVYEMHL